MKIISKIIALYILSISQITQFSVAEGRHRELQRNPFITPNNATLNSVNAEDANDDQTVSGEIILRATLTSNEQAIANINGKMLQVGQKINGYELIKVDVGSAVIKKNGKEELLAVNEKFRNIK